MFPTLQSLNGGIKDGPLEKRGSDNQKFLNLIQEVLLNWRGDVSPSSTSVHKYEVIASSRGKYEGFLLKGLPVGFVISKLRSGWAYKGTAWKGVSDGRGELETPHGTYRGIFCGGRFVYGVYETKKGCHYTGFFTCQSHSKEVYLLEGFGFMKTHLGCIVRGYFKNGRQVFSQDEGLHRKIGFRKTKEGLWEEGLFENGHFVEGIIHSSVNSETIPQCGLSIGVGRSCWIGRFKEGCLDGAGIYVDPNGIIFYGHFSGPKIQGYPLTIRSVFLNGSEKRYAFSYRGPWPSPGTSLAGEGYAYDESSCIFYDGIFTPVENNILFSGKKLLLTGECVDVLNELIQLRLHSNP